MTNVNDLSAEDCLERLKQGSDEHMFSFRLMWETPSPYGGHPGMWVAVLSHFYAKVHCIDPSALGALRDAVAALPCFLEYMKARIVAEEAATAKRVGGRDTRLHNDPWSLGGRL